LVGSIFLAKNLVITDRILCLDTGINSMIDELNQKKLK
jgi:hypothetical protein